MKYKKVALVHDYIKEFGGAERVLKVLTEMYPDAPIYTSFCVKNSDAHKEFKNKKIIESKWAPLIRPWRLYSPLRFLLPWIWGSIGLSEYDLVITSTSNYIARGFKTTNPDIMSTMSTPSGPRVVAYCHTPPRFLYGYTTGLNWQKYWPVRIYGEVIGHFLRIFDFNSAQKIDYWIANSYNVKARIRKFYRKEAVVIYPPVNIDEIVGASDKVKKQDFYFIAARFVGSKGLREAMIAAKENKVRLKVAGSAAGLIDIGGELQRLGGQNVEFLGRVSDRELWKLYAEAKGFIALARDEDFGMTVVEAQAAGTPVIAFNGGGFKESVINGKTGLLINDTDAKTLGEAFKKFEKIKWDKKVIQKNARRFSRERFIGELESYLASI